MTNEQRIYLDYNATAPVSDAILSSLREGPWSFANPSSVHAAGKKSRREVSLVSEYLYEVFGFSENSFDLVYHSGATEGVNSIVKGLALHHKKEGKKFTFAHFQTDHSCVVNQKPFLELLGFEVICLPVLSDGSVDTEKIIQILKPFAGENLLLNWTWVNNESGVILPLSQAQEIKKKLGCVVHVDAVQTVGKVLDWKQPDNILDFYTYSGHKFGALKGTGFSFIHNNQSLCALLNGGGQQLGLRSGTENTWGIYSIKFALEQVKECQVKEVIKAKKLFEEKLKDILGEKGEIAGNGNPFRNANTCYFIMYETPAHTTAMAFDMAGFDLSNGSACSSGAVVPSRVLLGMGYDELQAKSALRVSFSPSTKEEDVEAMWPRFEKVLSRFLN
ncbi:MAG: aminotransferase class V-fold PLP-dependent enzyme [Halobacteriovoraceae bacterium]|nr:aminotransferase class V-fold PLP-dependent enzyme [Halobacteriovoraceae bacterium]